MRRLHRGLALILGLFIILHLANHIALFSSVKAHLEWQETLRIFYRNPLIEPLLIAGFVLQSIIGLRMIRQRGWPKTLWPRIQTLSGALLALFLIQHITAALITRWLKPEIDTNIYWAASVVSRPEFASYFTPYYALGVTAIFAHIAAWLALRRRWVRVANAVLLLGALLGIALVATMMGAFHPIELPKAYEAYLDSFWF